MIGGSRKVILSFAGREADIVSISNVDFGPTTDGLSPSEEAVRRLDHVRRSAGERFDGIDIESSPFFTRITDDAGAAAAEIAGWVQVDPAGLVDHPNVLLGTEDEVVEILQMRRATYGVNFVTVQQRELEAFAPVVARLAGT
jgi:hypothetical protein